MDYFNAFWIGGLICALVQILMEKTKMMPGRIMVLLVVSGGSGGRAGAYGSFCRRLQGRCGGNGCGPDLRLSGQPDL